MENPLFVELTISEQEALCGGSSSNNSSNNNNSSSSSSSSSSNQYVANSYYLLGWNAPLVSGPIVAL